MVGADTHGQRPVALARPSHLTLVDASVEGLRRAIQSGVFAPGSQLPPEKDLVSQLAVSRTTVREALGVLEQQGLIVRRRGLGTFVVDTPLMRDLSSNLGITAMIREAGYALESHPGTIRHDRSGKRLAARFPLLLQGTPIIVIERIRMVKQRPVVYSFDIVPADLRGPSALDRYDPTSQSIYEFLANELLIRVTRGQAELRPCAATKVLASKLGVRRGSPLMRILQTDFDGTGHAVLFSIEYHVPDAFRFLINRVGPYR